METKILFLTPESAYSSGMNPELVFAASKSADMTTLSEASVRQHKKGYFGTLAVWLYGEYQALDPLSYAAHTKDRVFEGKTYRQVGGIITLAIARNLQLATLGIGKVLNNPIEGDYAGWVSVCNEQSKGLFKGFGFEQVGVVTAEESGLQKPLYLVENGQLSLHQVE